MESAKIEPTGQWLKKARELRQLPLKEIAQKTHIRLNYLTAMEADRWNELPGRTFAVGYVRAYAQYVGLDPSQALLHLEEYLKALSPVGHRPSKKGPRAAYSLIGLGLFLLLLVGFFLLLDF